ncbi:hypothetical protein DICPUDRAFT_82214 [Dictyostelium purpureum]|uniref:Uncharacterized protein n=1 Tax=Dictyostelium purpureum TaxID=5786 RepID=F0ZVV2_DICPU|nr:uncharacterized protein DICPUDRAFT_82214 [Dictyostelium purpureum]EGC31944.1 hypothetical protein DICPUDRAFT_82214 [Dictyostelium purpureum]|eukprot:XP_003291546.1 hypothetical protein DICPUDRAFT_82214 [Dictyostelium purpureum]
MNHSLNSDNSKLANIGNSNFINNNSSNDSLINFDLFDSKFLKLLPFNKNSKITIHHCKHYLNNVKIRFIDDPISYKTFEIILKEYFSNPQNIHYQDVYNEVALLFNDNHQDLLNQLAYFLPFEQD